MTTIAPPRATAAEREFTVAAKTQWQLIRARFLAHRPAMIGLTILVGLIIAAYVVPYFYPFKSQAINYNALSKAPYAHHILGTDTLGQDLFAEILAGIQTSFQVALLAVAVGESVGVVIGLVAGFYRGPIDSILMRLTDIVLTIPIFVLVAVLAQVSGGNWWSIALIIGGTAWTVTARLVRSVVLSLREREYIEAARSLGASDSRILFRHLLPNSLGVIVVDSTLNFAAAILVEAALSFLGFGIHPPRVSLGGLLTSGVNAAQTRPWLFYFPGIVLVIMVLCVNFVGDGVRDAFDPTANRVRA
ncbi:MAG: ABC transporter permease [Mycobacteriales bacterium]|nr:MAG: ABC transporter permease [Pseudonocardiales bacterium]